jgi:AraC-like DNA-binding protein
MLTIQSEIGHRVQHPEFGDFGSPASNEILGLLLRAMSLAHGDELTALNLVKKASRLLRPASATLSEGHRHPTSAGGLAPWQVNRLKAYIAEQISAPISLEELAQLVKLSTSYFSTAFKVSFGISPHSYIIAQRVEFAKHRMSSSDASLSEIALDCGLSDQAHLSRVFRRSTGTTPSAWRRYGRQEANDAQSNSSKPRNEISLWN